MKRRKPSIHGEAKSRPLTVLRCCLDRAIFRRYLYLSSSAWTLTLAAVSDPTKIKFSQ